MALKGSTACRFLVPAQENLGAEGCFTLLADFGFAGMDFRVMLSQQRSRAKGLWILRIHLLVDMILASRNRTIVVISPVFRQSILVLPTRLGEENTRYSTTSLLTHP